MLLKRKLKNSAKNLSATLQVVNDLLENQLGYTNSNRPFKPNLSNALKPSKLLAPTRLHRTVPSCNASGNLIGWRSLQRSCLYVRLCVTAHALNVPLWCFGRPTTSMIWRHMRCGHVSYAGWLDVGMSLDEAFGFFRTSIFWRHL